MADDLIWQVEWQELSPANAEPSIVDKPVMVFRNGRVTLGIYLKAPERQYIQRGWRVAMSPGRSWELARIPPSHWAPMPGGPDTKPQHKLGRPYIRINNDDGSHTDYTDGSPCPRCHNPLLIGWAVQANHGHVFLNCTTCAWNTESISGRQPMVREIKDTP